MEATMWMHFIVPSEKNNFTPHLLSRAALLLYILFFFALSTFLGASGLFSARAAVSLDDLIELHNQERLRNGLSALQVSQQLNSAAQAKADVMIQFDCWSHYCPDGKEPWDFFRDVGYVYEHAGENLAEGFSTAESVMSAWLNSPSHRENLLNPNFSEVGFGFSRGTFQGKQNNLVIAVHFGKQFTVSNQQDFTDISVSDSVDTNPSITIDQPQNGQYLADPFIEIEGTVSPENAPVEIYIDTKNTGRVNARGPMYTYRTTADLPDGSYAIQTKVIDQQEDIYSKELTVYIDAAPPSLLQDDVRFQKQESSFTTLLHTSEDVQSIEAQPSASYTQELSPGYWSVAFAEGDVVAGVAVVLTLRDTVGYETQVQIDADEVIAALDALRSAEGKSADTIVLPIRFLEDVEQRGVVTVLALGFIVYLLLLMIIDFVVLAKTNMLGNVARKSHVHIPIFLIVFIVIAFGGVGGSILTNGVLV